MQLKTFDVHNIYQNIKIQLIMLLFVQLFLNEAQKFDKSGLVGLSVSSIDHKTQIKHIEAIDTQTNQREDGIHVGN